ncbi:cytochrome c [Rhizobium sp. 16-449-1b]|uniref:c-type cytochrome n=1 Tax=Rhizobium sp. 16-449-1b TaxID=2819989 RepID=UPI001ADD3D16|nr:cytochrome c [Rhizobium sp. 16-449-1b]MBO9197644.1 cytochrome c [Rhizobium sp. 16-449-1b]
MRNTILSLSAAVGALVFSAMPTFAQDADLKALIERGHAVSIASDCMACHRTAAPDGKPFAGGYTIASPMGPIVAPNITPSKEFGIGNWTEAQFTDAVRNGVAPRGHLYPAMPYTAYRGMTDEDIHALYTYLTHDVAPVDEAPSAKTTLPFPFNQRIAMAGWNLLFNRATPFDSAAVAPGAAERGKYLVDALAHCGACHTPRNTFMAEDAGQYLGGGDVGGWHAPNITSDPISGIGGWNTQEIVAYLKHGNAVGKSQAAGPMAEAVEHSFRHMSDEDLTAMAVYLKTVPPIRAAGQTVPAFAHKDAKPDDIAKLDYAIDRSPAAMQNGSSVDGQELYVSACATCHQLNGSGTEDQFYPSLTSNRATGGLTASNLVMAIVEGIHRPTNDVTVAMPAFKNQLTNAQIAAVSNYVLARFGNDTLKVSEQDVVTLRNGGEVPLLIRATPWLMWGGACAAAIVLILLIGLFLRRKPAVA